jgi:hypothetical protein
MELPDFTLRRVEHQAQGIFGELLDAWGNVVCQTLEHAYTATGGAAYSPKLPPGTYTCVKGTHRLINMGPFETFEITGVEGHSGILFHVGNYNDDSEGCVLLGMQRAGNSITASHAAFAEFMSRCANCTQFQLRVLP